VMICDNLRVRSKNKNDMVEVDLQGQSCTIRLGTHEAETLKIGEYAS
jgi:hypothetical protein